MNGPDDDFRASIYQQLQGMRGQAFDDGERVTPEIENVLGDVLERILGQIQVAVRDSTVLNPEPEEDQQGDVLAATRPTLEDAQAVLVAVDEWASVASYAVAWIYAPASPLPARMAGWGGKAIEILRQIAGVLRAPLKVVAIGFQADSYSISVGFPWGVSVTLDWPVILNRTRLQHITTRKAMCSHNVLIWPHKNRSPQPIPTNATPSSSRHTPSSGSTPSLTWA